VVSEGLMTQEQALDYFNLKSYIIQSVFLAPVMGVLTSLIVAFVLKSKKI
jgi:phosphate/sulfate permease